MRDLQRGRPSRRAGGFLKRKIAFMPAVSPTCPCARIFITITSAPITKSCVCEPGSSPVSAAAQNFQLEACSITSFRGADSSVPNDETEFDFRRADFGPISLGQDRLTRLILLKLPHLLPAIRAGLSAAAVVATAFAASVPRRPNIVVVIADQWRAQA